LRRTQSGTHGEQHKTEAHVETLFTEIISRTGGRFDEKADGGSGKVA
jgi:hypothetical protein